ncbi:hypothetical protein [Thalassospira marina]|uniref:Resolvase HTH domain-containing protein n=1 Tax=Thalassospira marina TaxID=2048283 RepID=A0ABM6QHM0_9PROT|nr:hypothetical protein [Thalassospira marina]AUG55905.1 hypothetical protein CSC3H3_24135 [Thalassospira marina]
MPAEWGQAKIEILALQDEILAEIEKGISTRKIFEKLSAAKRITISRRSFYRRVKLLCAAQTNPAQRAHNKHPGLPSAALRHSTTPPTSRAVKATTPSADLTDANALPTLKAKEQAEFNRLWDGEDAADTAEKVQ